MARVWEADDEVLGRSVAVKLLHPHLAADASFVARFRAEAVNAARLAHPAIVSIYDTWSGDGTEAIVMELVAGTTLRHLIEVRAPLDVGEAAVVADHVASALETAHRAGIVHRDIKPANVLLSSDGRVVVTDFGIAKAAEGGDLTADRTMLGTAKYLAPEQVEGGPVDGRTDLYALGVVLYELVCGRTPFAAETDAATALARLQRDPQPPSDLRPDVPDWLEQLILDCLRRDPADRPASATEVRRRLAARGTGARGPEIHGAVAERPSPPPPAAGPAAPSPARPAPPPARSTGDGAEPHPPRARRARRRRWPVLLLLAAAAVVAVLLAAGIRTSDGGGSAVVAIGSVDVFDPEGDVPGQENNDQVGRVTDGDPATAWSTETYRDPERLGKRGVGLVARLDRPVDLDALRVLSDSTGWSASVYVTSGEPGADLESWGEPLASLDGIGPPGATFEVGGRDVTAVLVWITRTGDDGTVRIGELQATA
jgi:serine/threonine-protein kinase